MKATDLTLTRRAPAVSTRTTSLTLAALLLLGTAPTTVSAQNPPRELNQLSIEELMNIAVSAA